MTRVRAPAGVGLKKKVLPNLFIKYGTWGKAPDS